MRDLALTQSAQTARTSLFAGSRCRSPAKGQESCGERLPLTVGGRYGAERRRLASIGHERTCHSAGTSLALTSITMESPVAAIGGTAHLDVGRGDLEVKYDARVALGALQRWSARNCLRSRASSRRRAPSAGRSTIPSEASRAASRAFNGRRSRTPACRRPAAGPVPDVTIDRYERLEPRARGGSERERASGSR